MRLPRVSLFCSLLWAGSFCSFLNSFAVEIPGRTELSAGWKLISANSLTASGAVISRPDFDVHNWYPIRRMPATVLETLQEDGVYPNLYFGMNLLTEVPQDLYKQDWWYRTSFEVPPGQKIYWLELPGINYRAEIWLNSKQVADSQHVVGMYVAHEFNISEFIEPGKPNVLAIKVTPERAIPDVSGVELADSWHDWLDWKYLGSKAPRSDHYKEGWTADRNAGVWKPVYLRATGPVKVSNALVDTDLPLPVVDPASLTVYATVANGSGQPVSGVLLASVSREGKPAIRLEQPVTLGVGEVREFSFAPEKFSQLLVSHPDLWWPYTMGSPNLYNLNVMFKIDGELSDEESIQFGIRKVTQHRDSDLRFSKAAEGNLYFQVNGKDFHARGADYAPDLLFRYDPQREVETIRYVKDLGLNMLRWEAKIADEHMFELADQAGIPVMAGWMCCSKWEQWDQWNAEDLRVAKESLSSQILMLRSHGSAFLWSNGSDGLPPQPLRSDYRRILKELHWQNAVVDTVSNGNTDGHGNQVWDGIGMSGVDRWHPPSYWFDAKYPAAGGSTAEYGDNEVIPPFESLKKFIPKDKLWPINEFWYFHAGAHMGANELTTIRQVVDRRYGSSSSAQEFSRKAQLAHYENTRAQFEDWAANGWATHKIEMYWMLNNHWPSFFGHLFDYYMEPGGAYYGAKKGLRPLSVVFDYFSGQGNKSANIFITNQTMSAQRGLRVRVRIYDLLGSLRYERQVANRSVEPQDVTVALTVPRLPNLTPTYFVRCELLNATGATLADNIYWQSTTRDEFGNPANDDDDFPYSQASWSDFKALNTMPQVSLEATGAVRKTGGRSHFIVSLHNPTRHIAFFERVSVTQGRDGNEVLPILYSDNYVTVFPGETVHLDGSFDDKNSGANSLWLSIEGYNTARTSIPFKTASAQEQN
jgi:exo-1,4-beta-D-glucosaminidase